MEYVELHCKSNFSFLEGAAHPEDLAACAAALNYTHLALTDTNGLYGAVRFQQACQEHGVDPIYGSEVVLDDVSRIVLLATDRTGYTNLSLLLTEMLSRCEKGQGQIALSILRGRTEGLIALSGDSLRPMLLSGKRPEAMERAVFCHDLFGPDNYYLELWHHHLPQDQRYCRELIGLSRELGLPLVATNYAHYGQPDDSRLQDVLQCIKHHRTLDTADDILFPNNERYLKSATAMTKTFAHIPEAMSNTVAIAGRCRFELTKLPTSPPDFAVPEGETTDGYLGKLVYEGACRRYGELSEVVRRQLEHELRIIAALKLSGYFLIVWDICRFCRERNILSQGRGSAANSAVCYALMITAGDPIKLELLFERFISEERTEPPDIDIDIASDRREEVIQYVYNRYGRKHAAMVANVICYRRRLAVREVGKVLGFSLDQVDVLAKCLDHFSDQPEETLLRFGEVGLNMEDKRVKLLVELSRKIRGFPRHLGIHCGGVIVTEAPLGGLVPVEKATMPNRTVIQWDKSDAGDMGMVKIDLLGLGMLTAIDMTLKLVKRHRGIDVDISQLTYDDPAVYQLLCSADTVGVFQVESRAQMNTLPRMKPERFYDLVVEVAIIRPGPIQGDMVHPYLRRRNGEEEVTYLHPMLEPILKRTLGVPLFQEQGIRVAVAAAGFSPAQADRLRRSIGHRQSRKRIGDLYDALIAGMAKNGISREVADKIYNQLAAFSEFGFAESHAASFALLVYVSAWLKVYYPVEFYCALLNAQPMGFYTPSTIVYEAKRKGVAVDNVCVNQSEWDCSVEEGDLRLGLSQVLSLGREARERLERAKIEGSFASLRDFVRRTGLARHQLEQLAQVGAFDCFGLSRRKALWQVLALVKERGEELELLNCNDGSDRLPAMDLFDEVRADIMGLNLSTGPHPMQLFRASLAESNVCSAADLREIPDRKTVLACGMVVIRQRPITAKGFVFITLEDETGFANIVVNPNLATRFRKEVIFSHALLVTGVIERKDGVVNVIGRQFQPLMIEGKSLKLKSRDFR
jgi:error-prone DNA polymerase